MYTLSIIVFVRRCRRAKLDSRSMSIPPTVHAPNRNCGWLQVAIALLFRVHTLLIQQQTRFIDSTANIY